MEEVINIVILSFQEVR